MLPKTGGRDSATGGDSPFLILSKELFDVPYRTQIGTEFVRILDAVPFSALKPPFRLRSAKV